MMWKTCSGSCAKVPSISHFSQKSHDGQFTQENLRPLLAKSNRNAKDKTVSSSDRNKKW